MDATNSYIWLIKMSAHSPHGSRGGNPAWLARCSRRRVRLLILSAVMAGCCTPPFASGFPALPFRLTPEAGREARRLVVQRLPSEPPPRLPGLTTARRGVVGAILDWHSGTTCALGLTLAVAVGLVLRLRSQARRLSEAQTGLKANEQRWRAVFETTPECLHLLDREGRFVEMNPAGLRMIEGSLASVRGMDSRQVVVPEDRAAYQELLEAAARGEGGRLTLHLHSLKGRRLTMASTCVPVGGFSTSNPAAFLLVLVRDITEEKRAGEELLREKAMSDALINGLPGIFYMFDSEGQMVRWNAEVERVVGMTTAAITQANFLIPMAPEHRERVARATAEVFEHGASDVEADMVSTTGVRTPYHLYGRRLQMGDKCYLVGMGHDLTQRRQLEARYLQAQKMEAIGHLAGGVAHDFNNILSATMLRLNLLNLRSDLDQETRASLNEIMDESERAANLVRQLLMLSRRSVLERKVLDLASVITNLLKLLARLIGEHIEVRFTSGPDLPPIEADLSMMEQVVMNLALNARDAMPRGGRLSIRLEGLTVDHTNRRPHPEAYPGEFVCLVVEDNGCGMDEATKQRVFEPFFTTKAVGLGTGLGLATVHGIVGQHQGWIEMQSEVGRGTTFRVVLPVANKPAPQSIPGKQPGAMPGEGTILLVEDDPHVRGAATRSLRYLGYQVLQASNGAEALKAWDRHRGEIDVVLTDMVMPGAWTGLQLIEQFSREKPGLRAILASGYSEAASLNHVPDGLNLIRLSKPFQMDTLSHALQQGSAAECLATPPPASARATPATEEQPH